MHQVKIMIRIGLAIVVIQCLFFCSKEIDLYDNEEEIRLIDQISAEEIELEIEIDSNGQFIDTLSITRRKYASDDFKIYEERNWGESSNSKSYYREDAGLFYQEMSHYGGEFQTIYETSVHRDGYIVNAVRLDKDLRSGKTDTMWMDFKHSFRKDGTRAKLEIITKASEGEGKSLTYYNENEQILSQVSLIEEDTIQFDEYIYQGSKLAKNISRWYRREGLTKVYHYDEDEQLRLVEHFKGFQEIESEKTLTIKCENGKNGRIKFCREKDILKNIARTIRYIRT